LLPWVVVHHVDNNPLNNDINNLQAMTRSEHSSLHNKGSKRSQKFKDECRERMSGKKMSVESNLNNAKSKLKKLTQEEIIMIRLMLKNNYYRGMINDIAALYKINPSTIGRIRSRDTYGGV
jgi:hypothetical protein